MDQNAPEQKPALPAWIRPACVGACLFFTGLAGGLLLERALHDFRHDRRPDAEFHLRSSYRYINPLLECNQEQENGLLEFGPSERAVRSLIEQLKKGGDIQTAAVYFRDLNNGPWFGIKEDMPFGPASLLKLAHAIAAYKQEEERPGTLQRRIRYDRVLGPDVQFVKPAETLAVGATYTVEELVRRMVVHSDNASLLLLQRELTGEAVKNVYVDLGIEFDERKELSARSYATLLRVLFNASYLTKNDSERLLGLLSESDYKDGLRAGVPADVPIAHKFGERALRDPYNQLHDCGIVYYPRHPYLLCVMTRGMSYEKLSHAIAAVSETVYREIRLHYANTDRVH